MGEKLEEKYTLKQVSEIVGLSPRTIRLLEKEGLIKSEKRGRQRYYSEEDLEKLKLIKLLRCDFGVNLPGVEIILNMRERMIELLEERDRFLKEIRDRIREEIKKRFEDLGYL